MANLIIKSSADNLVLQGSDASPAITVGATGTTTFAENATFSGTANNLGTATAGTLSSGVTFPAGHVIQVVEHTSTTGSNGTDGTWLTAVSGDITLSKNTHKILCIYSISGEMEVTSGNWVQGGGRVRSSGSGTDQTFERDVTDSAGPYGITFGDFPNTGDRFGFLHTRAVLFSPAYEGATTITAEARNYGTSAKKMWVNMQSTIDGMSTLLLMEVVA